jgi:uncharacterized oxidoreductase
MATSPHEMSASARVANPIALITGGSSGIGRAFAAALHGQGWRVIVCGRQAEKLARVELELPGVMGRQCDLADAARAREFAADILAQHERLDLLINCAGGLVEVDFTHADVSSIDVSAELRANLEGAIHLTGGVLPALKRADRGCIVMVTSGYALAPATRAPVYSAAKAGLRAFTKALRRQLSASGIRVIEVAPPLVDTPAVAHRRGVKLSPERVVSETLRAMREGRTEVYPGRTRLLPLLLRIAPRTCEDLIART